MQNDTISRDTYHHGNLPKTLVKEGAKLLAEKGVNGFSMREVARRAGVAVAAPSHHFGNSKGLLTAIAAKGFNTLAKRMELAATKAHGSEDQVVAMCQAYRAMVANDPGYAAVMFRLDLVEESDQRFQEQASCAFGLFAEALRTAVPDSVDSKQVNYAAKMLWATMQGLIDLDVIDGQEAEELIHFSVRTVLTGLR